MNLNIVKLLKYKNVEFLKGSGVKNFDKVQILRGRESKYENISFEIK